MEEKPVKIDPNTGRLIATRDISKEEVITLNQEEWLALGNRQSIHSDSEIMVQVNVVSAEEAENLPCVMLDGWKPSAEFKKRYPYFG